MKKRSTLAPRNVAAKALREGQFRHQVVANKKRYTRKGKRSSSNKFEDSFQFTK